MVYKPERKGCDSKDRGADASGRLSESAQLDGQRREPGYCVLFRHLARAPGKWRKGVLFSALYPST